MSLKNKLNRLKPHIVQEKEKNQDFKKNPISIGEHNIPFLDQWEKENVRPFFLDDNYCLIREKVYPITYQHGKYTFKDFLMAVKGWNERHVNHPLSSKGHSPENLYFFDTETTGLGGGAGNTIFILGSARFKGNEVVVKQQILPHPGAEVPLYHSFLEDVDYTTMVTYNGKAFDWPQVKTRHTLIREHVPKLPSFGHFDLYHAAKRLWKHRLNKMKLSTVEEEVLGVKRIDDIPGFLAPMIYFDFVENKEPEGMLGILKHNELDILSLITLYTHISLQLLRMDEEQTSWETFEVGKWYSSIGEKELAKNTFADIAGKDEQAGFNAMHALAFEYKRNKLWDEAKKLWSEVVNCSVPKIQIEACIELAKILEHRDKNYKSALDVSYKAQKMIENQNGLNKHSIDLQKRINRLEGKYSIN